MFTFTSMLEESVPLASLHVCKHESSHVIPMISWELHFAVLHFLPFPEPLWPSDQLHCCCCLVIQIIRCP